MGPHRPNHPPPSSPLLKQFSEAWWTLGRCCRNAGQLERAEAALTGALALLPAVTGPASVTSPVAGPACTINTAAAASPAPADALASEVAADLAEVRQLASSWLAERVGLPGLRISQDPGEVVH